MERSNAYSDYPGVVVMPGRVGGKPTLGNSRVPAELIAECLDEGESPEEIAFNYTVKVQDFLNFKTYRDAHAPVLKPENPV